MQISRLAIPAPGFANDRAETPTAVSDLLAQPTEAANLKAQIAAYQETSGRWRTASDKERAALTPALTDSAFAQRAQAALNTFTRAAWAGADASPPAPQARMLSAFDGLSDADQQIVAGLHMDRWGKPAFASAAAFRDQLVGELRAAAPQVAASAEQSADRITLSDQARARLARGASEAWAATPTPATVAADPEIARAVAAYASV